MLKKIFNETKTVAYLTIAVVFIGYYIQVKLPYDKYRSHASGPYLAQTNPIHIKGREIYQKLGCQYCHTQNLRPLTADMLRFANTKESGYLNNQNIMEDYFNTPSVKGSTRIGPDLSRIAMKYSPDQITALLKSKGDTSLKSAYHQYSYLFSDSEKFDVWDGIFLSWKIRAMMNAGLPYSDPFQNGVFAALEEKTKGEALVDYLSSLGEQQNKYISKYYKK